MPQSKEAHRKTARESARRKRGSTSGVNIEGPTVVIPAGVNTLSGVPSYLVPILTTLGDKEKRAKIRAICKSSDEHNVTAEVRYGINGPTMDKVSELLEAF